VTGGFDMAFGLFNFCVDNDGVVELISISDSASLVAETSTPIAVGGQTPSDRATGAIGGGIKADNFDPVSRVE
jgi:hypothetical protein